MGQNVFFGVMGLKLFPASSYNHYVDKKLLTVGATAAMNFCGGGDGGVGVGGGGAGAAVAGFRPYGPTALSRNACKVAPVIHQ